MYGPVRAGRALACKHCGTVFASKSNRARHERSGRCRRAAIEVAAGPCLEKAAAQSVYVDNESYPLHLSMASSLRDWMDLYVKTKGTADPGLCDESVRQVLVQQGTFCSVDWTDPLQVEEVLESHFVQLAETTKTITRAQRARYVRWLARYLYSVGRTPLCVLEWTDQLVADLQRAGSRETVEREILAVHDPYYLNGIRSRVVNILREYQSQTLDPVLLRHYRTGVPSDELLDLGDGMKCFLDLALRFTNVPLRVQCTASLVVPWFYGPDFVAKLVNRGDHMVRLVNRDKTASRGVLPVPVPRLLSAYLMFYLKYCRVDPSSPMVFQTRRGKRWTRASRDIKRFLSARGFDPLQVESNGRFVHGSRHVGLASFALAVDFATEPIRGFCTAMRTSLETAHRFYCPWLAQYQAQAALRHVLPKDEAGDGAQVPVLQLRPPSRVLAAAMQADMLRDLRETTWVPPVCTRVSRGTQTEHDTPGPCAAPGGTLGHGAALPACSRCQSRHVVCGPVANRRHANYGQYFTQCRACCPKRQPGPSSRWYPLGVVPSERSVSYRPRNMDEIQRFIAEHGTTACHTPAGAPTL